jgi:hypothetical protein
VKPTGTNRSSGLISTLAARPIALLQRHAQQQACALTPPLPSQNLPHFSKFEAAASSVAAFQAFY